MGSDSKRNHAKQMTRTTLRYYTPWVIFAALAVAAFPISASAEAVEDAKGTTISAPVNAPPPCLSPDYAKRVEFFDGSRKMTLCAVSDKGNDSGIELSIVAVDESGHEQAMNSRPQGPLDVYLSEGTNWRRVLHSKGHYIRLLTSNNGGYPDVEVRWDTESAEVKFLPPSPERDRKTLFVWNGKNYQDAEMKEARRLDTEALALFYRGKWKAAIAKWEGAAAKARIPGLGLTADAETLNNLGFAYLKMGRGPAAEEALLNSLRVDPRRWAAHLNLADHYAEGVYIDKERIAAAVYHYRQLLALKPDYKFASKIQHKIDDLTQYRDKYPDQRKSGTFRFVIHRELPVYRFDISKSKEYGLPDAIHVRSEKDGQLIQKLKIGDAENDCEPTVDSESMISGDYNFDGYADIAFSCYRGATGNEGFLLWLYSPAQGRFNPAKPQLFENPKPDPEERTLDTHRNNGSAGMEHTAESYSFERGKFVLVREETQEATPGDHTRFVRTVSKRVNGKMKKVSQEIVNLDE